MGEVDAVVEHRGLAKDEILDTDLIGLLGIFAAIEPREVADARTIGEMSHHTFLAWSHGEGLEAQDLSHHLHERHITRQFVDGIDLRTVNVFIGIVFQQVAIALNAEFIAQHLLAIRAYTRQVFNILV